MRALVVVALVVLGACFTGPVAPAPPPTKPTPPAKATPPADRVDDPAGETYEDAFKAYDRADLPTAKAIGERLIASHPDDERVLRLLVSIACLDGVEADATTYYVRIVSAESRAQMRTRCDRYGITLPP